jgi:hypothetical protein
MYTSVYKIPSCAFASVVSLPSASPIGLADEEIRAQALHVLTQRLYCFDGVNYCKIVPVKIS